jgi:hypothetical protein
LVKNIGWDFVGRVSKINHCLLDSSNDWQPIGDLYKEASDKEASDKPKYLGGGLLGKSKKYRLQSSFYCYKGKPKQRKVKRIKNKPQYHHLDKMYSEQHKAPWVIVTSLTITKWSAKKIINTYYARMQIEQNFRDDKNERWGFGLRLGGSRKVISSVTFKLIL